MIAGSRQPPKSHPKVTKRALIWVQALTQNRFLCKKGTQQKQTGKQFPHIVKRVPINGPQAFLTAWLTRPLFQQETTITATKTAIAATIAEVVEHLSKLLQKNWKVAKQMRNSWHNSNKTSK